MIIAASRKHQKATMSGRALYPRHKFTSIVIAALFAVSFVPQNIII
jgi:hypothetical protein